MSKAVVVTAYGGPEVLQWRDVAPVAPGRGQVSVAVRAAGVGPTDLAIRRGALRAVFPLPEPAVLGFEVAGVVDALGAGVQGTAVGDEVVALLPQLGGYTEQAVASVWARKPPEVSWEAAAAVPASAEAAVGVLRQVGAAAGETVLVLGAAGSVGLIAVQLALADGLTVLAAASSRDHALLAGLGAVPVEPGPGLSAEVLRHVPRVDAAVDAAGVGADVLAAAVELAGGPDRVRSLVGAHTAEVGVRLSEPGPDRAPDALQVVLPMLAAGRLRLRERHDLPMTSAADAHGALERSELRGKVVLTLG